MPNGPPIDPKEVCEVLTMDELLKEAEHYRDVFACYLRLDMEDYPAAADFMRKVIERLSDSGISSSDAKP